MTNTKIVSLMYSLVKSQDGSTQQRRLFDQLFRATDKLPIYKDPRFSVEDIEEAMNLTRMAICGCDRQTKINANLIRKLCNSVSNSQILEQRYLSTFQLILKYKVVELIRKNRRYVSLDVKINSENEETFIAFLVDSNLNPLEQLLENEFNDNVAKLIDYIINDGQALQKCYPKGKPHCNAQVLIKKRFLEGKKWSMIGKELNVSVGTISGRFFYPKCIPLLQEMAQKFEVF